MFTCSKYAPGTTFRRIYLYVFISQPMRGRRIPWQPAPSRGDPAHCQETFMITAIHYSREVMIGKFMQDMIFLLVYSTELLEWHGIVP